MRKITRDKILKKYKNTCRECGEKTKKLEMHHVIPLCCGGRDDEDNIIPLCHDCHKLKPRMAMFREFFKIGINKDYIMINKNLIQNHLSSKQVSCLLNYYFKENDAIYRIDRGY